jgi:hypothetical protein
MFSFDGSDLAGSPDSADVTATISEIHGAVDVENLLHDSLPAPAVLLTHPGLAGCR